MSVSTGDYEKGVDHLTNAIAVCGQPQQLLQVLQQTLPPPVFQMLLTKLPTISQVHSGLWCLCMWTCCSLLMIWRVHQPDPCQFVSMFVINVHLLLQRIVSAQNLNEDDIEWTASSSWPAAAPHHSHHGVLTGFRVFISPLKIWKKPSPRMSLHQFIYWYPSSWLLLFIVGFIFLFTSWKQWRN